MADEDITLDGKPLQSLRVADLKAALEQRNLPKSGQKNTLIKRLKGALMLENLQKSSSSHSGLQPNSQIGEEMSQNSFIKQYLAKQQELLRQRLEREAQQDEEAEESPAVPEEDDDHSDDNDGPFVSDKHCSMSSQPAMTRDDKAAGNALMGHAMMACAANMDPSATLHPQESFEAPGAWMQRAAFLQGHKEPPAPSPPRAVASLSVRVLGQPDRQGLPPAVPRAQEKEGTAPSEPGSAHSVLHLSRSAAAAAGSRARVEDDDDDSGDDESEDDDDWGPGPGGVRRGNRPPPQQMPPTFPATAARSKRKLQPPQHIPPPQVHHTPMQLRHPTPPPSPPPDLFPLPDTPKQSPPDAEDQERGPSVRTFPPPNLQRQDSDSSSRSSSPEPLVKRKPGPLSLLVHKMETEGAFTSAAGVSGESAYATAGPASSGDSLHQRLDRKRLEEEKKREKQEEQERERTKSQEAEKERKRLEEEKEKERKRLEEEEKRRLKEEQEKERKRQEEEKQRVKEEQEREKKRHEEEKERERKRQEEEKRREQQQRQETAHKGRVAVTEAQDSSSDSDSKSDSSSRSSRSSSSSGGKNRSSKQLKKVNQDRGGRDEKKTDVGKEVDKRHLSKREVSEPSAAAVTEVEPDSESSVAQQPPSGAEPENSEGQLEEVPMPLPLPLLVPAAYYYYHHQHQHLLHSSSYSSYNSCLAMPKCAAGT